VALAKLGSLEGAEVSIQLPIKTERLVVRCFVPEADAEPMLRVYGDSEVMRFIPGGALSDEVAVRSLLERYTEAHQRQGFSSWAVVDQETGEPIGDAGFGIFEPTGEVELGYTLARDRWGQGYATEAARACLAAGLEELEAPRIIAVVDAENEASLRLPERIGMKKIETIHARGRPHVLFAAAAMSFRVDQGLIS
jgi:[ribosomal protein S5]-alanine N-acetyltransferase